MGQCVYLGQCVNCIWGSVRTAFGAVRKLNFGQCVHLEQCVHFGKCVGIDLDHFIMKIDIDV